MNPQEIQRAICTEICRRDGIKAREIARELDLDHQTVNHYLYSSPLMKELCWQDRDCRWHGIVRQERPHTGLQEFAAWFGTAEELIAALWENETDLIAAKARLRMLISDLKKTLDQIGMEAVLVRRSGRLSILRDRIPCDYYSMLDGDMEWVNRFYGEYMSQYSWAEVTRGKLTFRRF